jgi:hypothetical protein
VTDKKMPAFEELIEEQKKWYLWKNRSDIEQKGKCEKQKKKQAGRDDIQVQLQWIKQLKDQIDFCNNKEVLPDFELFFKVCLTRVL